MEYWSIGVLVRQPSPECGGFKKFSRWLASPRQSDSGLGFMVFRTHILFSRLEIRPIVFSDSSSNPNRSSPNSTTDSPTYCEAFDANIYLKRNFAPLPDRVRSIIAIEKQLPALFIAASDCWLLAIPFRCAIGFPCAFYSWCSWLSIRL